MNHKIYHRPITEFDCASWFANTDAIAERLIKKGRDEDIVLELLARAMPNGMLEFLDQKIQADEIYIDPYRPTGKILSALSAFEYGDFIA